MLELYWIGALEGAEVVTSINDLHKAWIFDQKADFKSMPRPRYTFLSVSKTCPLISGDLLSSNTFPRLGCIFRTRGFGVLVSGLVLGFSQMLLGDSWVLPPLLKNQIENKLETWAILGVGVSQSPTMVLHHCGCSELELQCLGRTPKEVRITSNIIPSYPL